MSFRKPSGDNFTTFGRLKNPEAESNVQATRQSKGKVVYLERFAVNYVHHQVNDRSYQHNITDNSEGQHVPFIG
jgi:hypothetical protein